MATRLLYALLLLSVPSSARAGTPAANLGVRFKLAEGATWKSRVWSMPVAARSTVEKAIAAEAVRRFDSDDIEIELSPPHGFNIAFDGPRVTAIPRVFGRIKVRGVSQGEIFADARRGKVSVFEDETELRPKYGLRNLDEVIAERRTQDRAPNRRFRVSPQLDLGALNKPVVVMSRLGVNGQFPGATIPTWLAANPLVQMGVFLSGGVLIPSE